MLYETLQEQLQECLPEFQRQFVIQNYQKFIEASKENDPLYKEFLLLIDRFKQAGMQIDTITNDINDLKNAKSRCKERLTQRVKEEPVEDVQAEDQLTEMLDNLSMFTFEKNYEQAIESHKLLTEALQSKKFMKLIKKPEIHQQVDLAFKSLCQSLYNDYTSQNAQYESSQLMQYLMVLNQIEMLIQGYLQIQEKKFIDWIDSQNQCNEKSIQQFVNNIIKINQQFEQIFQKYLKKNQFLFSFISIWNQNIISVFFTQITKFYFQDIVQFDDLFNKAKTLLSTFAQYQSKGISLDFDIQRELAIYIENKITDLFSIYGQKINQFMHFNDNKLIKLEYMNNLLDGDKLLESSEVHSSNKPQEIKIKASATIKSTFDQLSQPLSISSCFFWNIVYRLGDSALNFFNPEQYPLLSTLLNDSIGKMLVLFVKDYQQAVKSNRKEGHVNFEIGNIYGNFNLNNTLSQYLQGRASLLSFANNSEWKKAIQDWYEELRQLIIQNYKVAILSVLPFWICEHGKIYCQKQISGQRPSPLFLMIAYTILELKNQFQPYISQSPSSYFLHLLWDYVKYLLEYSIYWSYHQQGKNNEVFFLDRKSREELQLDMNQINLYLQQGAIKIQQITIDGLKQFIYDVQFIFDIYNRFIGALPQNDQFLKKIVTLYCKEKKCDQIAIDSVSFEQYITGQFQKDMMQAKTFIEQQRKSLVT